MKRGERGYFVKRERENLIQEIGELASHYEMNYVG